MAEFRASCGELGTTDNAIRREPYLQNVGAEAARITWTSERADGETLVIWAHGDTEPQRLTAEVEPTTYLVGATQRGVALDALLPSTEYCYELVDAEDRVLFGPTGFRTAPDGDAPVRLVAFGDSGFAGTDQQAVIDQLNTVAMDAIIHVGDMAYESGTLPEFESTYFEMYGTLLSSVPLFPAIGDHDDATDRAAPYREVFTVPPTGGEAANERWYSFDYGNVHVTVTDSIDATNPAQLAWLEADLAAAQAAGKWRIVVSSYPLYSSGFHGSYAGVRQAFEPIFMAHDVHLVLSGDDHDYERTQPIDGVTYIVTGGGGRSSRPVATSSWTAFSAMTLHFLYITVEGDVMRVRAIDAAGQEFDGVEIARAATTI